MPLESGHKVTIWSIEDKGTYARASLSGQKKDKDGQYQTDWSNSFCTLYGKAYEEVKGKEFEYDKKTHIDAKIGWGYETERETSDGRKYTKKQAPFSVSNNKANGTLYTNYAIYDMTLVNSKSHSDDVEETNEESTTTKENVTPVETPSQNGLVGLDFLNIPDGFVGAELPFK